MSDTIRNTASNDFPGSLDTSSPGSFEKGESAPVARKERIRQYLIGEVRTQNVDFIVILCWFTTGLLDGTIFNGMLDQVIDRPSQRGSKANSVV